MRGIQAPDGAFFYAPSTREPYKRWAFSMTSIDTCDQYMTGGKIVLRALRDNGVKHIFGYPGAAVLPIYDELFQQDEIMHILPKFPGVRGRGRNN